MLSSKLTSLELFSGAGGLSLGAAWAGVRPVRLFDSDQAACEVLRTNSVHVHGLSHDVVTHADVGTVRFADFADGVDILLAGAPCQPWSLAGQHRGPSDARNLFAHVVRAVAEVRPKAIVLENVQGLVRPSFQAFREKLIESLRNPLLPKLQAGSRVRQMRTKLGYRVFGPVLLNAADFGTAQSRKRVFIVALRSDVAGDWTPPASTHCARALLRDQAEDYWARHGIKKRSPEFPLGTASQSAQCLAGECQHLPWRTVRDCLQGLPDPRVGELPALQHTLVRGARRYPGHTGSDWDAPAKTLKAGVHGVPGGENMLKYSSRGHVRYFTIREAARLQDFPDSYQFSDIWSRAYRQIGNAVPVGMASAVIRSVVTLIAQSMQARAA